MRKRCLTILAVRGLDLQVAKRLEGKEFSDVQALYRQVWQGR